MPITHGNPSLQPGSAACILLQCYETQVYKLTHFLADQAKRELDDRDLTSRSDLRKERKESERAFADLARALCECTKKQFERLVLDGALHEVTVKARQIESPAAKDRALRLVRRELRNGDWASVKRQLESLNQPMPRELGEAERWLERLLTEGDDALTAFLTLHPHSDRNRLRQLMMRTKRATGLASNKASNALLSCITDSIEPNATAPDPV